MHSPFHCLLFISFTGLQSAHFHNGTIEFSRKPSQFIADQTCSTFRFSNIKFVFHESAVSREGGPDRLQYLFVACGHNRTVALEDCVLETSFDSPALLDLVVCCAAEGGQVRHTPKTI
jgi:hypothetical protein